MPVAYQLPPPPATDDPQARQYMWEIYKRDRDLIDWDATIELVGDVDGGPEIWENGTTSVDTVLDPPLLDIWHIDGGQADTDYDVGDKPTGVWGPQLPDGGIAGAGGLQSHQNEQDNFWGTGNTQLFDDTIPTTTTATSTFAAVTHTPAAATNVLRIEVSLLQNAGTQLTWLIMALFVNSETTARATSAFFQDLLNTGGTNSLVYWMVAGTTDPITFSAHPTQNGSSSEINGVLNGVQHDGRFNGRGHGQINVTEYVPA